MPDLVDLKLPKKTKAELKEDMTAGVEVDQPRYPYETSLRMGTEMLEKLPVLHKVAAGDELEILAKVIVKNISLDDATLENPNPKRNSVQIQIIKMDLAQEEQTELDAAFDEATS